MNIWIDGFEANVPQRLGSSQVAFGLLSSLEKIDRKNHYTILLASPPLPDLPKEREGWRYQTLKIKRFKTYLGIPQALWTSQEKPDLFFSPTHYGPISAPCRKIITIFDLSFLRFPEMFKKRDLYQLKLWTKISVRGADRIITISQSSKKDLEKYYRVSPSKITVAYPGYDSQIFHPISNKSKIESVLKKYGIDNSYIIYMGTIQPRKNIISLIRAFEDIQGLKLVVVGKIQGLGRQAWMYQETLAEPKRLGIEGKITFTGFAPTEDLPYLLAGAQAYCLPSFFEGFGIPVLESMATGTPVIVSDVSSLPEVVGKSGLYIDPNSVESIKEAILKMSDQKLRDKLSKLGLERAKQFSWDEMAKSVLEVFNP